MSHFFYKTIVVRSNSLFYYLHNPNVSTLRIKWFSISSKDDKRKSYVVSYLKKSFGFSHEVASSTSKYVKFDSPDKPNEAIEFLRNNGFSETQIAKLVRVFPGVLISDTQQIILPKLEFFKAKGASEPEMAKLVSYFPKILKSSLIDQIIPSYNQLRNFFQCDKRTINAVKRYPYIIGCDWNSVVANANVLQEHGVPDIHIASWIEYNPRLFLYCSKRLREAIEDVSKMGFDSSRGNFAIAVRVFVGMRKSIWESKIKMFQKCGFSHEEISKIFRNNPNSMSYSQKKISATMKFFVEEMKWKRSIIVSIPAVLGLSLKRRIIPRCSVYKVLLSKGLVNKKANLKKLLGGSEERFLETYVERYEKDAPELLELYKKKISL